MSETGSIFQIFGAVQADEDWLTVPGGAAKGNVNVSHHFA